MSGDDDLRWYVPGFTGRRRRPGKPDQESVVTVSVNGNGVAPQADVSVAVAGPTRYSLALRRQASNRVRKATGRELLPAVRAGSCTVCDGWGVVGARRERCARCNGSGEE